MSAVTWPDSHYESTDTWWKSWRLRLCPHWGTASVRIEDSRGSISTEHRIIIPEHPSSANALAVILFGGWRIRHQRGHYATATSPTGATTNFYVKTHHDFQEKTIHNLRSNSWKQLEQIERSNIDNVDNMEAELKRLILLQPVDNVLPLISSNNPPKPPPKEWRIDLLNDPVWRGALDAIADMHESNRDARFD